MSDAPHEIVIIRRRSGGHEDEHHGGVWKIAFADFMTAMMAFFLVMWLISANDKTKAVIARYFNPVQLVDSTPQPKGLEDPKVGSPSVMPKIGVVPEARTKSEKGDVRADSKVEESKAAPDVKTGAAAAEEKTAKHEAELFRDPYAVLSEIAGRPDEKPVYAKTKASDEGQNGGSGAVGIKGGQAYRDPFEPLPLPPGAAAGDAFSDAIHSSDHTLRPGGEAAEAARVLNPAETSSKSDTGAAGPRPDLTAVPESPDKTVAALSAKLEAAVKSTAGLKSAESGLPQIEVKHSGDGTVIDLTDGANFSMFASASAEPSRAMVRLMDKIGQILKSGKGRITIRGFTDGRPFRSTTYDNWRLSAARAHMAHYMLVHGGVDEARFDRIEGYADRQPKNSKDVAAPENRRIEILVQNPV